MGNSNIKYKRIANPGGVQGLGGSGGVTPVYNDLDPVISQTNTPPAHVAGERYLINTAPTGAWVGNANSIAESDGAAWTYTVPVLNDYVYITSTLVTLRFNGTIWVPAPARAILQNGNSFGASGVRVGTNDAYPTWIKYNNTLRVRIDGTDIRTPGSLYLGIPSSASAATARLHVRGAGATGATYAVKIDNSSVSPLFYIQNDGFVGIGVSAPTVKLHIVGSGTTNGTSSFKIFNSGGTQVIYDFNDAGQFFMYLPDSVGSTIGWRVRSFAGTEIAYIRSDSALFLDNTNPAIHFNISGALTYRIVAVTGGIYHQVPALLSFRDVSDNEEYGGLSSGLWYFCKKAAGLFTPSAKVHIQGNGTTTAFGLKIEDSAAALNFSVRDDGRIAMPRLQTGNAGLSAGDTYKDTAANILAAGDYVVGMKA